MGRFVRIVLDQYFHGFKPKLEEKHLVCVSRNYKIKNCPCTVFKELSGTFILVGPGSGGNCGWPSSPTLNAQNLLNIKQNMKKRLLLLKPILTKLLLTATRSRLFTKDLVMRRMNLSW